MALGPRLDLRQSQQLVMTPQLQQAIKLLALTNLEIEAFVTEELECNPLLEVQTEDDRGGDDGDPDRMAAGDGDADHDTDGFDDEPLTADRLIETGDGGADAPLDVDYDAETFHHDSAADTGGYGLDGGLNLDGAPVSGFSGDEDYETAIATTISLHDHLTAQAGARFKGADLLVAAHLIDLVDETGYLTDSVEDVADRLDASPAMVEAVLKVIQTFDPSGIGARSLAECLAIQAREVDRLDPAMARLLDNLELLARGELSALRRICGVDQEDLSEMIDRKST